LGTSALCEWLIPKIYLEDFNRGGILKAASKKPPDPKFFDLKARALDGGLTGSVPGDARAAVGALDTGPPDWRPGHTKPGAVAEVRESGELHLP